MICNNDKAKIDYLINWFAHSIQKPEEKPGVAIVMRSGQGYGKGSLMKPFSSIFGAHYMHSTNSKDISSNFNAVLENKLMVFFDEAFAGTNQATDILKGLITEDKLRVERKGFDTYFVDNYIRIVMASNRENIIRFEKYKRRYLYIDVPESNKQSIDKFDKYYTWEKNGGAEKLFGYLKNLNIENFNPRVAPKTNELNSIKMYSFSGSEQILYHILNDENSFNEVFIQNKDWGMIYKQTLSLAQIYGVKKELINNIALGKLLTKLGFKKKRRRTSEGSTYEFIIPFKENIMNSIRTKFEEVMGFDIEWCPLNDHLELVSNNLEEILIV
ncbi:primase-helicase family protein [Providencia rettgeri]|uniref:primase-helicase family protein n=1 Tax=Providencia rettgeri TaxID=587 RepID=UPI003523C583